MLSKEQIALLESIPGWKELCEEREPRYWAVRRVYPALVPDVRAVEPEKQLCCRDGQGMGRKAGEIQRPASLDRHREAADRFRCPDSLLHVFGQTHAGSCAFASHCPCQSAL